MIERSISRLIKRNKEKDFKKRKRGFLDEYKILAEKWKCDWMIDQFVIDIADKIEAIEKAKEIAKEAEEAKGGSDIKIISP